MVDHVTKPFDPDLLVGAILGQLGGGEGDLDGGTPGGLVHPAAETTGVGRISAAPPPAQPARIDWSTLLAHYGNRRHFVAKLVASVRASQADTPDKLRQAAREQDLGAIAFLAHSLKGMAGNLMADTLRELAAETETAARAGEPGAIGRAEVLAGAVETLLAELAQVQ
jgi:HPt (histidine-containing phosphotransfer) domain-containing protein